MVHPRGKRHIREGHIRGRGGMIGGGIGGVIGGWIDKEESAEGIGGR